MIGRGGAGRPQLRGRKSEAGLHLGASRALAGSLARENRALLERHDVTAIEILGPRGAGKTTLLELVLETLQHELSVGVLVPELPGPRHADGLEQLAVSVLRVPPVPRGAPGPRARLDAPALARVLSALPLDRLDLLLLEGPIPGPEDLVLPGDPRHAAALAPPGRARDQDEREPADPGPGSHLRVVVASAAQPEDAPLAAPWAYRSADLVLLHKVDLLAHLDFALERFLGHLESTSPGSGCLLTSARSGHGVRALCDWLRRRGVG